MKSRVVYYFMPFRAQILILWSLTLLGSLFALPQTVGTGKSPSFLFTRLSLDEGLSQSSVTAVLQDSKGFIWIGTGNGLNRYDGYTVTSFHSDAADSTSLSNDYITCLTEDSNGILWIGTHHGLNSLDSNGHTFKHFLPNPRGGSINSRNHITGIVESSPGVYWVSTFRGLGQYDQTRGFTRWFDYTPDRWGGLSHEQIYSMTGDPRGYLWLATRRGVNRVTVSTGDIRWFFIDQRDSGGLANVTSRILIDSDGKVLVGSYGAGLFRLSPESGIFTAIHPEQLGVRNTTASNIEGMLRDADGRLWVGTRDGLFIYDSGGLVSHIIHAVGDDESLSDDITLCLYKDRASTIWIGTQTGGVSRINRKRKFLHYRRNGNDEHSLLSDLVWSFAQDSTGKLWVGTDAGLNRFESGQSGGTFSQFKTFRGHTTGLGTRAIQALATDGEGRLWIGTDSCLRRMDIATGEMKSYAHRPGDSNSITSNSVAALLVDHLGNLWAGTADGLNVLTKGEQRFRHYSHSVTDTSTIAGYKFQTIFEDHSGYIWAGTPAAGISRLNPNTGKFQFFQNYPSDTTSINSNYILCFGEDANGVVWVGTDAGLNRFNEHMGTFTHFTVRNGLPNNVIYSIQRDSKGKLWISCNKGVVRFDPANGAIRTYDVGDGLQSNEFNIGSGARLRDGRMIFGGVRGFNIFDPDNIGDNAIVPKIVITGFALLDGAGGGATDVVSRTIHLGYLQNYFSIQFVGLEYSDPAKIRYQYSMDGFRSQWVDAGVRREAVYSNLDPGEYRFRVRAANSDGVWSTQEAVLSIVIEPPFWQRAWFRLGSAILVIGLVVTINNFRVRRKVRLALELERIRYQENASVRKKAGDDFHDEFGHKLTRIAILGEVVKHLMNGETSEIRNNLDKIIETSADLSVGMRDFLWTLNPDAESARDLAIRLKDFGDDFFSKTGVDFHMDALGENLADVNLPVDWRRHCILLGKEAMNNVLKHAHCTIVRVRVAVNDGVLVVEIRDNGTGFDLGHASRGQGLASMRQRAGKVGGTLTIQSGQGEGTTVRFEGKLPAQAIQRTTPQGQE